MTDHAPSARRPLSRARVIDEAVSLADDSGVDAVSMRGLAHELGVVPMALYKHVANKEELLAAMVDRVVGEIDAPPSGEDWKGALRARILAAREVQLRHPWARRVMEAQTSPSPTVLSYTDSVIGMMLDGGLSVDLSHHAMHALGSRIFGFSQELHQDNAPAEVDLDPALAQQLAQMFPNIVAVATFRAHDPASIVGSGCDDRFEFEFALDILLDGFQRMHDGGWSSTG